MTGNPYQWTRITSPCLSDSLRDRDSDVQGRENKILHVWISLLSALHQLWAVYAQPISPGGTCLTKLSWNFFYQPCVWMFLLMRLCCFTKPCVHFHILTENWAETYFCFWQACKLYGYIVCQWYHKESRSQRHVVTKQENIFTQPAQMI